MVVKRPFSIWAQAELDVAQKRGPSMFCDFLTSLCSSAQSFDEQCSLIMSRKVCTLEELEKLPEVQVHLQSLPSSRSPKVATRTWPRCVLQKPRIPDGRGKTSPKQQRSRSYAGGGQGGSQGAPMLPRGPRGSKCPSFFFFQISGSKFYSGYGIWNRWVLGPRW